MEQAIVFSCIPPSHMATPNTSGMFGGRTDNTIPYTSIIPEKVKAKSRRKSKDSIPVLLKKDDSSQGINRTLHGKRNKAVKDAEPYEANATEKTKREERKTRFGGDPPQKKQKTLDPLYRPLSSPRRGSNSSGGNNNNNHGVVGGEEDRLVGENTNLEKPYLRLTTFPKKEDVRPIEVLVKSLAHIKSQYIREEDFEWANEQLKSVRQDITVQHLRNHFVLDVYETHARILLEHGDLNEFNQCQTMIRSLAHDESTPDSKDVAASLEEDGSGSGLVKPLRQSDESADEFRGYAVLYALVRNSWTELKTELARTRSKLLSKKNGKGSDARESCSKHSLQVVNAVTDNDYRTFFRLYDSAPHMSAYLMDFLVKRVRDGAYDRIISSYRPSVSVEHFRECLCFRDLEETRRFLRQRGAVFVREQGEQQPPFWVDCKACKASA